MMNINEQHGNNNEDTGFETRAVVLLVDDQAMVAEGISRMLANESNIELHYCDSPRDAIHLATEIGATTILQDLVMPEMDGMTLVRFYRANPKTRDIPIIVLSSREDATTKSDAFRHGANDYLVKLPEQVELIARILAHSKSYLAQKERDLAYQALRELQSKLEDSNIKLEESNRELQRLSSLDGLTGIANRRQFDKILEREWQRALRNNTELSLIMLDIDFFKLYNDNYGHQIGDDCLRTVSGTLNAVVHRPSDLVARYGGEEFALILPETGQTGAMLVAKKVQSSIADLGIEHKASKVSPLLTFSIGCATITPQETDTQDALIRAADEALYRSKGLGRNYIELAKEIPDQQPVKF